jgi:hypothetical protein
MIRWLCDTAVRTSPVMARSSVVPGWLSSVTSMAVRMVVNGVRNSCAALAVNIR